MIAGRYKSAEYLHYHPHHQSSKQQLARIIVDFSQQAQHRQHNYHHHYHRQQRKDHHSVRRSSLQTQQQQHKYPWECHHHHHYYYDGGSHDEAVAAPIVDAHPFDDSVNYYHHPFDDAANYHHTRRARRQLPTVPTAAVTAAEPPPPALLKSAQSANALLSRNTHHKCQQQLVNEEENKVPMSSANSSSWSYRLNKAGATNNQWSQEECGGANLALHRNSHPSLFSNTETQEDRWPRTSNQQQTNFHNGTTTTCRVLPSDQQVRQQSPRPPGTQCQMIMATSPKVRALRHGTFTATGTQQRPALISQRSLQCPTGSPKLAQKKIANHRQMASVCQPSLSGNSSLENHRRKISAGAYFWASNSSPTEAFLDNYTATSDFSQFNWSPTQPTQYVPFLSNKLQHLANVRANSNPTICCRRGGVERQILRRSPNSDLAPRFQRQHQQNFDYQQQQYSQQQKPDECSRGSSFSNESTPGRNGAAGGTGAGGSSIEQDPDNIDPVYLALKQATEKYGTPAGSRRGSQNIVVMMAESLTPSPRELSQTSLQDSGTYSGNEFCGASRNHAFALGGGSTPHLHGISVGKVSSAGICGNGEGANSGSNNTCQQLTGGRRPKLSEKMKSLSLDCAEMPEPVQSGMIRQQYKSKPIRSARGRADISVQQSFDKSASPIGRPQTGGQLAAVQPAKQRRLPPVPSVATALAVNAQYHHPQQQAVIGHQQDANSNSNNNNNSSSIMHIIMHEYSSAECVLRPGDRVVVVDNGDPDWKHGFKFNDGLERLMTFPSSCVAAYHMEEQPMKLLQSCNLVEQKIRLYRDQIVFAQPNGLSEDGRLLLVRNEHSKQAQCPLQFLTLT